MGIVYLLYFQNTTELSAWQKPNVSKWPNNPDGTKMLDGIGLLVGAKVYIENDLNNSTVDTLPITDLNQLNGNDYHTFTIYKLATERDGYRSYRASRVGFLSCIWLL